jgi:hypothetical protein
VPPALDARSGRYMKREAGVYRLAERGQAVVDA